ncbi:hypothetical protein DEBA109399_14850 [Dermacoccus barathri]
MAAELRYTQPVVSREVAAVEAALNGPCSNVVHGESDS